MYDISQIDKNFEVKHELNIPDMKFWDVDEAPFRVYGLFRENGKYRRMPESIAQTVNESVQILHSNTAGGRVRFMTDSPYVAIHAEMDGIGKMPHFALVGSGGFDLYADGIFIKSYVPPCEMEAGYESVIPLGTGKMREITIHFPLYSNVKHLYIGLSEGAVVKAASPYKNEKPVVYYGSSITQGGCASRPGMSYQNIVSMRLGIDYINLGFSSGAKAEDTMIDYIKKLDMSVFVYDYDHNAPTSEHYEKTHEKMFLAIREAFSELPIIMMNRPRFYLDEDGQRRLAIMQKTYQNAINNGDKNVYMIDNKALTRLCGNEGTVDGVHPTDFGFASMANAVCEVLGMILK